jgi:acetyl esterase/lipase
MSIPSLTYSYVYPIWHWVEKGAVVLLPNYRRVPTPNAYELYQGLQDMGVETKLVIYNGFGHGITKPKERLAAVWHNWDWFAERVFGEEAEMPGLES